MIPWQQLSPFKNTIFPLLSGGREIFGTVIKHGKMSKTVTVRADFTFWKRHANRQMKTGRRILAHDEFEECVAGDKVVIVYAGNKISKQKAHYVRTIEVPFPRLPIPKPQSVIDRENQIKLLYKQNIEELKIENRCDAIKNKRAKTTMLGQIRAKAMVNALQKVQDLDRTELEDDLMKSDFKQLQQEQKVDSS